MPDQQSNYYGFDHFIWRDGERLRTRYVRNIRPRDETNAEFQHAMDRMAAELSAMHGVTSVEYVFAWRDGAIVECILDVQHTPRPIAVIEDDRPAGGRPMSPRGNRGGLERSRAA